MNHKSKLCPRCSASFECKPNDIANCQCAKVQLSDATLAYLKKTNYDCLCQRCLQELNALVQKAQHHHFPQPNQLKESLHFYKENGFFVFTEFYHLLR
jgi:hypothetical protein